MYVFIYYIHKQSQCSNLHNCLKTIYAYNILFLKLIEINNCIFLIVFTCKL